MRHFVFRWPITTAAVMVALAFIGEMRSVLLILNAALILLTLGSFILIVNGLMLYWVQGIVSGFHVDNFGSAFWGTGLIGLVSWMLSAFFEGSDGRVHVPTHYAQIKRVHGRMIEPESST